MTADNLRSRRWGTVPIVLVVAMLLGSVLIPARQTWRIMQLLRETTELIEPARLLGARLELGLTMESAALEGYALTRDRAQLARYRAAAAEDDRRLELVEDFARRLDSEAIDRAATVRRRLDEWREVSRDLVEGHSPSAQADSAIRSQQASYQAALVSVARLASYLAAEGSARRDVIRGSERLGLLVNASLVFVALGAVVAVGALSQRERRLTMILQRRIEEEAALRQAARVLGVATTTEEALRQIAEAAIAATHAPGAYVESTTPDDDALGCIALDRTAASSRCTRRARAGSLTEANVARNGAGSLMEVESVGEWMTPELAEQGTWRAGLVAPLSSSGQTFGVLVLLRDRASGTFSADARRQLHMLADLASAALHRVAVQAAERRTLEEAQRRTRQEVALREAAEALAAAYTAGEVTQQIARLALEATQARGAFVEQIVADVGGEGAPLVQASAGSGVPASGALASYAGAYANLVLAGGEPVLVEDLARAERSDAAADAVDAGSSAIIVPLGHPDAPIGALFIVGAPGVPFRPEDLVRARTFGHLAELAYEKVRLLEEAREGHRALERVMKSRSRLMRGFSHDVKNPLGAADGYAALLSDGIFGALSAEQRERVVRIRGSIQVALALIDDLHELARTEAGHIVLTPTLVDLTEFVQAIAEEYRAAAEAKGLSLSVDEMSGPLLVETDRVRVQQIVGNLLSNAIKYTTHGSVMLRARRELAEQNSESERWAVIEVSDTGRGIPAKKQEVIFEEFVRLDAGDQPGVGLGLAISQKLAQALDGRIAVRSEPGGGSTFTLRLPPREAQAS